MDEVNLPDSDIGNSSDHQNTMETGLHWADYVIFCLFLGVSLGIGVYHAFSGGQQRTTGEFIMANRNLRTIPTMLSLLVSHQSAIMILGYTAEMYTRGSQAWLMVSISIVSAVLICERLVVPWLYPMGLTSVYEYFEMRFHSRVVRCLACVLGSVSLVLYMGTALYAPSVALQAATGFPLMVSIPLMGIVCTIYTTLGGMRAVIWTDVFQFLVMLAGMLAVLIKGNVDMGGFLKVLDVAEEHNRLELADWNPDPTVRHTVWGFMFGYTLNWVYLYGFNQASVQRFCATRTLTEARMTMLLNIPAIVIMVAIACITGLTVFAHYAVKECDPLASGQVETPNQILAFFVKSSFKNATGFSGMFLATLYSGALSSVSSGLSALAANTWEDILKFKLGHIDEFKAAILTKVLVVIYGIVTVAVAFLAAMMPGPVSQVSIAFIGAVAGPLLGLFLVGGTTRFVNTRGAVVGALSGLALNLWITVGKSTVKGIHPPLPPVSVEGCDFPVNSTVTEHTELLGLERFYSISYLWYVPIGCLTCVIISMIVSLIPPRSTSDIPDQLMMSMKYCCVWNNLPNASSQSSMESISKDEEDSITKQHMLNHYDEQGPITKPTLEKEDNNLLSSPPEGEPEISMLQKDSHQLLVNQPTDTTII